VHGNNAVALHLLASHYHQHILQRFVELLFSWTLDQFTHSAQNLNANCVLNTNRHKVLH
jgi:hypothetical protein